MKDTGRAVFQEIEDVEGGYPRTTGASSDLEHREVTDVGASGEVQEVYRINADNEYLYNMCTDKIGQLRLRN